MNRMTQSFAGDSPLGWVLPTILSQVADRQANALWVTDETQRSLTFRQAHEGALRAAGFFQALGVQRSPRVAMSCPTASTSCRRGWAWGASDVLNNNVGLALLGGPAEIIALCKLGVGSVKSPKSVDFCDALPRTSVGKVQKKELRANYWRGRSRAI